MPDMKPSEADANVEANLEAQIATWRRALADLSEPQRDELEDHLREHITDMTRRGLTSGEAFAVATMRTGRPAQLRDEFDRADPAAAWVRRLRWMVLGFLGCGLANALLALANNAFGYELHVSGIGLPLAIALRMLFLSAVIALAIALWHMWINRRPSLLHAQPPAWLTGAWTLSILVALLPWVGSTMNFATQMFFLRRLSLERMNAFALSSAITGFVLPFTTPLILLIISITLARSRRGKECG